MRRYRPLRWRTQAYGSDYNVPAITLLVLAAVAAELYPDSAR